MERLIIYYALIVLIIIRLMGAGLAIGKREKPATPAEHFDATKRIGHMIGELILAAMLWRVWVHVR